MKCILINKNKKVALININPELNTIDKIFDIYNIDFAPLSFKNAVNLKGGSPVSALNNWYRNRGIPSWRKDISNLLEKLNISSPDILLNKAYSLSLSDQYWIKEESQEISWENINFFTNDFEYKGFFNVSFSSSNKEDISLFSPNNTTDGMLAKAWIIDNGKRCLIKGTYSISNQEPINEWLTSEICKRLDINYCPYEIVFNDNKILSKCECFINENEEIISAYDIFMSEKKPNHIKDFDHYVKILENNGIENARKNVEDMFMIDYIVMNFDRHMKNYGIIRNVETGKWERLTPIFDTGESLNCNKLTNEINFFRGEGKFFTNTEKDFFDYLKEIDITRYDLSSLKDIPEIYKEKLSKTSKFTDITEERIKKLVTGLETRINNLSETISKKKELIKENLENNINNFLNNIDNDLNTINWEKPYNVLENKIVDIFNNNIKLFIEGNESQIDEYFKIIPDIYKTKDLNDKQILSDFLCDKITDKFGKVEDIINKAKVEEEDFS